MTNRPSYNDAGVAQHAAANQHAAPRAWRYAVATISDTSSAAFEGAGVRSEASQLLLAAAARARDGLGCEPYDLLDSNGHKVGQFVLAESLPEAPAATPGGCGWISVQVELASLGVGGRDEDLLLTYVLGEAALRLAASGDGDGFLLCAPGGQLVGRVVTSGLPPAELDVGLASAPGAPEAAPDEPGL